MTTGSDNKRTGISGWSSIIATWVSIFGAFGGGFLGLQTYSEEVEKMEDARVVQTFGLYEMFNSAERLEARARLFEHTKNDAPLDANDLYVMLDFYDALHICVERELCDRDLSVRLFQSYAAPFWDNLSGVIVASRTATDPSFGAGLQWMAGLPLPAPIMNDDMAADPSFDDDQDDVDEDGAENGDGLVDVEEIPPLIVEETDALGE